MKTNDFINALVADQGERHARYRFPLGAQMAVGLAVSLAIFFMFLGIRADLFSVMTDPHVIFKFIMAASLFGSLLPLVISADQPEIRLKTRLGWLALPLFIMAGGIVFQLITSPADYWLSGMMGRYPAACLRSIPALAIGPFLVLLWMLKNGAPAEPVLSGAVAGAVSAAIAAFIYALHCPDDSALFVALWYTLSIGSVTIIGALIGHFWLRW
jgi:hypothetical protein